MKNTSIRLLKDTANSIGELSSEEYAKELSILNGNSVGKHLRHILELYQAVLEANKTLKLNYDQRKRDIEIEVSKDKALEVIEEIISEIQTLDLNQTIEMRQCLGETELSLKSEIQRELLYNIEHTVHHLAIIRIGIEQNFPRIQLSKNFGIAYSTISYREAIQN